MARLIKVQLLYASPKHKTSVGGHALKWHCLAPRRSRDAQTLDNNRSHNSIRKGNMDT